MLGVSGQLRYTYVWTMLSKVKSAQVLAVVEVLGCTDINGVKHRELTFQRIWYTIFVCYVTS